MKASTFAVVGSINGKHKGKTVLAGDGKTILFTPAQAFAPGESVAVAVKPGIQVKGGATLEGIQRNLDVSSKPFRYAAPCSDLWNCINNAAENEPEQ